jgi:hypothetical protein
LSTRVFYSEDGRKWMVAKVGSLLEVHGTRSDDEKLYDIARSCAYQIGVTATNAGTPLADVNEHRRIWSTIWQKGESTQYA